MDADETPTLNELWECPKCGTQIGCGTPYAELTPPRCGAHGEMEQKKPGAWCTDWIDR